VEINRSVALRVLHFMCLKSRISEDNLLPGFRFKVPMMIVLGTLQSDDPSLRRIGETWMRCSLKSYTRYAFCIPFVRLIHSSAVDSLTLFYMTCRTPLYGAYLQLPLWMVESFQDSCTNIPSTSATRITCSTFYFPLLGLEDKGLQKRLEQQP
jgi:hypothetical protein